jgi:uncharacterized sodium:solute symporter family permease YidK
MFGKYNGTGFASKARVSACKYFLVSEINDVISEPLIAIIIVDFFDKTVNISSQPTLF